MRKRPASPPPPPSWRTDYESIASGEPAARSVFDIYTGENTVTYLKSPCSAADVQAQFFLHVIPEDVEDLPADRRQYGFDNLDFHYAGGAALAFGGRCIAKRPLPTIPSSASEPGSSPPTMARSGWPSSPLARSGARPLPGRPRRERPAAEYTRCYPRPSTARDARQKETASPGRGSQIESQRIRVALANAAARKTSRQIIPRVSPQAAAETPTTG